MKRYTVLATHQIIVLFLHVLFFFLDNVKIIHKWGHDITDTAILYMAILFGVKLIWGKEINPGFILFVTLLFPFALEALQYLGYTGIWTGHAYDPFDFLAYGIGGSATFIVDAYSRKYNVE